MYEKLIKGAQVNDMSGFDELNVRNCIIALIEAIRYSHDMEVIHRDIKLENLLIASDDEGIASVKIGDFGMARQLAVFNVKELISNSISGSAGYVAPEVLTHQCYSKACDYWSIGVVAYTLLSGRMPFYVDDYDQLNEQEYMLATFNLLNKCEYDFEGACWEKISEEAKDFISNILVLEPENRLDPAKMMQHSWMSLNLSTVAHDNAEASTYNELKI